MVDWANYLGNCLTGCGLWKANELKEIKIKLKKNPKRKGKARVFLTDNWNIYMGVNESSYIIKG